MVLAEGSCPISTPGVMVELFSDATSGSNSGNSVHIQRFFPKIAKVSSDNFKGAISSLEREYAILASRNFTNEVSNVLVSTLALR